MAAALFTRWQAEGTLRADPTPCLYPYRMTDTTGRASTGVIGALGSGRAGPGERHPAPRADPPQAQERPARSAPGHPGQPLADLGAVACATGLTATFDPTDDEPTADAYDDDGVRHQLWVLDDRDAIDAIADAVAEAPVVIADGHHRYQTALTYQGRMPGRATATQPGPYDLVLALIVELAEDQLTVGAIHRTISGLPPDFDLVGRLPLRGSTSSGPGRPTNARSARWPRPTR